MQGSMRWVVAALALLATLVVAIIGAATSQAASTGTWMRFSNKSMTCSVSRPGGSEGATCVISTGALDGWAFLMHPMQIEITNASGRSVFKKKTANFDEGTGVSFPGWQYKNEGVACRKLVLRGGCMLRYGGLEGWGVLAADDEIEVTDLDNNTRYRKSVAS